MSLSPNKSSLKKEKESGSGRHCMILGPCSAESEDQVIRMAEGLKSFSPDYFRAGIWKPRTSPGSFEGVGKKGLKWLGRVKKEYGIKTATEVANARHVEECLEAGIDLLWIGARTTVNPFTVQEIADSLQGVNIPVMVKNPINPDLKLWIGAINRIQGAGITKIMACHRGFNVFGKSLLRNPPLWEIPIEFKRMFPEIPIICDPSHIAGSRQFIYGTAQKSLDLGLDGLMIETHFDPDAALSDAQQQVNFPSLKSLLEKLRFPSKQSNNESFKVKARVLREAIDQIDENLLNLLSERMKMIQKIGDLKKENNLSYYQHERWTEIVEQTSGLAHKLNLNEEFVLKVMSLIHLESIDNQAD